MTLKNICQDYMQNVASFTFADRLLFIRVFVTVVLPPQGDGPPVFSRNAIDAHQLL